MWSKVSRVLRNPLSLISETFPEHLVAVVPLEVLVVGRGPAVVVVHRVRVHALQCFQNTLGADEGRVVDVDETRFEADDPVSELRLLLLRGVQEAACQHRDVVASGGQKPCGVVHARLYAAMVRIEERVHVYELHDSSPAFLFFTYDAMKLMTMTATIATSITV